MVLPGVGSDPPQPPQPGVCYAICLACHTVSTGLLHLRSCSHLLVVHGPGAADHLIHHHPDSGSHHVFIHGQSASSALSAQHRTRLCIADSETLCRAVAGSL
eukprot:1990684-Rhodomonas_salina.1